ncbi:hypothetical protein [Peribacillus cavernae]|uniref:hypothetical protein n=1 Tax=Peribacillus cavernae TaxID=1674310 RepID=UPI00163BEC5E|nr:hypothetical protein [Peribacillus cavernae]MDQ0217976.1 hypothetical protein [Peribacillus cavernae]
MIQLQVKPPMKKRKRLTAEEIIKKRTMQRKSDTEKSQRDILAVANYAKRASKNNR